MTNSSAMNFQRGNVVLCRTPMPSTQLQEFKVRPAVIISASRLNEILEDVIIVPLFYLLGRNVLRSCILS